MDIENKFYRVSAKALVVNDEGKVLLLKEEGDKGWELPGGGWEHGDSAQDTIRRELVEETGFEVASVEDKPAYIWTVKREKEGSEYWTMLIAFKTTLSTMEFTQSGEAQEFGFFSAEEMADLTLHPNIEKLPALLQ